MVRALHAFQHAVLRLPDFGKRSRNKSKFKWDPSVLQAASSYSRLLHHQRLRLPRCGAIVNPPAHLAPLPMNFFFVGIAALCGAIPAAPYWHSDSGFHAASSALLPHCRRLLRSLLAGSFANTYVMSKMKIASKGVTSQPVPIQGTVAGAKASTTSSSSRLPSPE